MRIGDIVHPAGYNGHKLGKYKVLELRDNGSFLCKPLDQNDPHEAIFYQDRFVVTTEAL